MSFGQVRLLIIGERKEEEEAIFPFFFSFSFSILSKSELIRYTANAVVVAAGRLRWVTFFCFLPSSYGSSSNNNNGAATDVVAFQPPIAPRNANGRKNNGWATAAGGASVRLFFFQFWALGCSKVAGFLSVRAHAQFHPLFGASKLSFPFFLLLFWDATIFLGVRANRQRYFRQIKLSRQKRRLSDTSFSIFLLQHVSNI